MPKETIYPSAPAIDSRRIEARDNLIDVTWGRCLGFASIGVREPNYVPGERETGHYTSLSADEIDRLIRVLRKAKRQAFGA